METQTITDTPRIYVASLADYNGGKLHGTWIEANQDAETIMAEIAAMLAASTEAIAEEWAIHDYEGFGTWRIEEYERIATVAAAASLIAEHDDAGIAYLTDYANDRGPDEWEDDFNDRYQGCWDSPAAYAEDFYLDTYGEDALVPLLPYVDFADVWQAELRFDMNAVEVNYQYHIFASY